MKHIIKENHNPYPNEIGYPFSLPRQCNSSPEIVKFKCPVCAQALGEEWYYDSCEEIRLLGKKIAKEIVQDHNLDLEIEYLEEMQRGKGT